MLLVAFALHRHSIIQTRGPRMTSKSSSELSAAEMDAIAMLTSNASASTSTPITSIPSSTPSSSSSPSSTLPKPSSSDDANTASSSTNATTTATTAAAPVESSSSKRSFWPSWAMFKRENSAKSTSGAPAAATAAVSSAVPIAVPAINVSKSESTGNAAAAAVASVDDSSFLSWVNERRRTSMGGVAAAAMESDNTEREVVADLRAIEDSVEEKLTVPVPKDEVVKSLLLRASSHSSISSSADDSSAVIVETPVVVAAVPAPIVPAAAAAAAAAGASSAVVVLPTTLDPLNWAAPVSGEPLAQTSLVVVRDAADSSPLMTSLPNNLSQLINLVSLNLSGHNLSKIDIPLGQLTLLRTLTLSRNQLRSFGNGTGVTVLMPLLQELDLSNNALAVMPFGATVRATALRSLNCSQNQIRKFVVDHVRAMPSLTSLCLLNNGITGLPAEIGELTNLVELQLAHNRLSALPDSLSNLQDLSTLELSNNLLRALPSSLSALPALWRSTEEWSLGVNALSESPLYELRTMEHLRVIDLHDNSIALWPESFAALTSEPTRLGALALVSSFLSGRSSSTAGAIAPPTPTATTTADIVNATTPAAAATRAFVASSSLTPTGTPTKLGAVVPASSTTAPVPPTTAVVAAVAPVSDVVSPPRPFGAPRAKSSGSHLVPPQLSELILRNNRLSSINACVDDMQQYVHLKRLDLSHNAFKSVPQELVLLTALEHLDLSDCASLLVLPADLSGFKRLSTLLLARCGKLAELPVSLASLPALQAFSFSHLSAAAPRALGVAVNAAAADADDVEKAEDDGGYVPSRHCVGAICDADAMRARFQYNISLRVLGGAPHPLAGAMLLALAAADGKRFLHNDGIKHMRSFVARPDACAAESEPFRVVAADFVGRTMSLLARDEQFRDRLVQDDSLSLLLLLAENKHHGVVSECAVALTSLCGFVHEPQLVADARATVDQAIDPASVAATSPAATAAAVAPVKEAAASTPTATPTPAPTVQSERDLALAAASRALATWAPRIVNAMLVNHAGNARVAQGAMMALYFLSQRDKACELVGKSPEAPALFHFLVNAGLSPAHHTGSFLALQTLNNYAFSNHRQLASGDYRLFERIRECLAITETGPRRHLLERAMRILGYEETCGVHRSLAPNARRRIRVLALDGGGTRGLVSLAVLKQIELRLNGTTAPNDPAYRRIHEFFDLICGTSTGGIIAFSLGVMRWKIEDVASLYLRLMRDVFSGSVSKLVYASSIHDTRRLEALLKELAGTSTELIDTMATPGTKRCFVPATRTTTYPSRIFIFRNYQHDAVNAGESHYAGSARFKVWQALRATSSAPLYLEAMRHDGETFADGGLIVNNPSAVALHEANRIWGPGCTALLLSIGTGNELAETMTGDALPEAVANANRFAAQLDPKTSSWGSSLWERMRESAVFQTMSTLYYNSTDAETTHLTLREVCPEANIHYQRLNPAHRIYNFPLDTTDEATLDAMTSYATHWMHNDAAPQLESLCATLRELDRASQANEK